MKTIWVFLFLALLVLGCCDSDNLEGESVQSIGSDLKKSIDSNNNNTGNQSNGSDSVLDSKEGEKSKRGRVQVKGFESIIDRSNSSDRVPDVRRKKDEASDLATTGKGAEKKKIVDNKSEEPKKGTKGEGIGGDSVSSASTRKDGSRFEECDPSNRCIYEVNKLVACLRVPGNESPHLSLLIQNQGKGPLTVTISAPEFVNLERTKAELQEKEDTEVKVSIEDGVTDTILNLTSGKGRCSLDFRDLITRNSQNDSQVPEITYTNFFTRTSTVILISLAALLIVASSWICISFRRKRLLSNNAKYEMLDMELPVAVVGGKGEFENDDGWENSWGDDWGDEEAPRTPTLPVTPNLSSKGLAARRMNKDGWKD